MNYRYIILLVIFVVMGFMIKDIIDNPTPPADTPYTSIDNYTGQSGTQYVSENEIVQKARELIRNKDPRIVKDIIALNDATYVIRQNAKTDPKADLVYNGKQKYVFHEIHLPDQDGVRGPAIGYVMIHADGRVVSKVYNFDLKVNTAINGNPPEYKVYNTADLYMKQSGLAHRSDSIKVDWTNKPYKLEIENAELLVNINKIEKDKIVLDFYADFGVNGIVVLKNAEPDLRPNVGFNFLSLRNDRIVKYRFLRFGAGYSPKDNVFDFSVAPVLYNLGNLIPFMHNTYIGPILGYDSDSRVNLGGALVLTF